MKIYTRTGDDGTTGTIGGGRVRKSDLRIHCTGAVDELNACVGLAATSVTALASRAPIPALAKVTALTDRLYRTQRECFVVGAYIAAPDPAKVTALVTLDDANIARLELEIDEAQALVPSLKFFILPGGSEPSARLHLARTICRRAESLTVELAEQHPQTPTILAKYLNRLSDWLFVQARFANHIAGVADVPWQRD